MPKSSPINLPPPWLPPLLAGPRLGEDPSISEVPNRASGAQTRLHFPAPSPGCWVPARMLSSYLMGLLARGEEEGGKKALIDLVIKLIEALMSLPIKNN